MGGDEGNKQHLMFFPGLMMQRQGGSTAAFALPGFPPQIHLPMPVPGAYPPPPPMPYACAGPGYAFAQAHAYAYPPPPFPAGPYADPPQGYPHPSAPHQGLNHDDLVARQQIEITETTTPKAATGSGTATAASASATAAAASYGGAISSASFGRRYFGNCCGGHHRHGTSSFKQHDAAGHGGHHQQGKFKQGPGGGHSPGTGSKVEHVRGKFSAKRTTWKH